MDFVLLACLVVLANLGLILYLVYVLLILIYYLNHLADLGLLTDCSALDLAPCTACSSADFLRKRHDN